MHARVVPGVGVGVLFREVSSVHECPCKIYFDVTGFLCVQVKVESAGIYSRDSAPSSSGS